MQAALTARKKSDAEAAKRLAEAAATLEDASQELTTAAETIQTTSEDTLETRKLHPNGTVKYGSKSAAV